MPGQRMHRVVVTMLRAVPMLPMPADQQADDPVVGAVSRREGLRRERRVGEPANVGRRARPIQPISADEAEVQNDAAQRAHPEAEGIEAREGHVARADHQRHQIIRDSKDDGHGREEDHGRAMHGEHAIEGLGRNQMIVGDRQLGSHDRGFHPADYQEQNAIADIHQPDLFVIDGDDPVVHTLEERPAGRARFGHEHRLRKRISVEHRCSASVR